jgi:hypothetical protein
LIASIAFTLVKHGKSLFHWKTSNGAGMIATHARF